MYDNPPPPDPNALYAYYLSHTIELKSEQRLVVFEFFDAKQLSGSFYGRKKSF